MNLLNDAKLQLSTGGSQHLSVSIRNLICVGLLLQNQIQNQFVETFHQKNPILKYTACKFLLLYCFSCFVIKFWYNGLYKIVTISFGYKNMIILITFSSCFSRSVMTFLNKQNVTYSKCIMEKCLGNSFLNVFNGTPWQNCDKTSKAIIHLISNYYKFVNSPTTLDFQHSIFTRFIALKISSKFPWIKLKLTVFELLFIPTFHYQEKLASVDCTIRFIILI